MTDGEPTIGEREPDRILENLKQASQGKAARVFVWGVGNDLNANLLDRIASQQRGDSYYVLPGENIEVSMSSFYDKISHPVLTDLSVTIEGVRTSEIYPRQIPDLFHGGQLLLLGRFKGEGHAAIRVKGKVNGKDKEFVFEGAFKRGTDNVHIPRLWAKRKIGYLLEEIRKGGATNELKQEVVRLARRHGLPTPYTSYLVLEEGALTGGPRRQPAAPGDQAAQNALRRLREGAKRKAGEAEEDKDGFAAGGGGAAAPSGKEAVRGSRLAGPAQARRPGRPRRDPRPRARRDRRRDPPGRWPDLLPQRRGLGAERGRRARLRLDQRELHERGLLQARQGAPWPRRLPLPRGR